jgi:hypothetical protein
LAERLPDYEVPGFLMQLEKMPLNSSGKINRQELPRPSAECGAKPLLAGTERVLGGIWRETLDIEKVGATDNFFAVGEHSLAAARLQAKIDRRLKVHLPLSAIFDNPSIWQQAKQIEELLPDEAPAFTAHEPMPSFELSSSQKGIYILESLGLTGTTYNIPLVLDIKGPLDRTRLNQALDKVIKRHASLRTYFEMHGHQAVQRVAGALHLKNTMHATQEDELEERIKAVAQPFDLAKPPLIHTALHEISKERHVLVFDVHHAIFDGMSMRVFLNDLAGFYRGEELPDPAYQYQDYVLWQKGVLKRSRRKQAAGLLA